MKEAESRAESLQHRVAELEVGQVADRNSKIMDELRQSHDELTEQLQQLKLTGVTQAEGSMVAENEADTAALHSKVALLEAQLASAKEEALLPQLGASPDARTLQLQVRELTRVQGDLERERSELARRAAYAEAQLAEIQQYLGTNIGRYQKEILRLRQSLERVGGGR